MNIKKILIAIVLVALVGFLLKKYVVDKPNENIKNTKTDYAVNVSDIFKLAIQPDSSLQTKYIDKVVTIKGVVKNIENNDLGTLITVGDTTASSLICQVDERNKSTITNVKENDTINIKGKLAGFNYDNEEPEFGASIQMNFCTVEK